MFQVAGVQSNGHDGTLFDITKLETGATKSVKSGRMMCHFDTVYSSVFYTFAGFRTKSPDLRGSVKLPLRGFTRVGVDFASG